MKLRFWAGVLLLAIAAGLFAYRGQIVGYVAAKWEQKRLPEAITYSEVATGGDNFLLRNSPPPTADQVRRPLPQATPAPRLGSDSPRAEIVPPVATAMEVKESIVLPAEFNLAVPFTSQAPYGDWNLPYKEACEEASVAMVDAFYKNRELTKRLSDEEIKSLVNWEVERFGYFEDTNAEETARILRERYGYKNVRVVYDPTVEMIKREVMQGRPVILPAAGRLLGNRYFRQPGPVYHMLVVRGWTKDGMIITNDPGTKRGEGYLYKPEVLMNAVHDWNDGDVYNGKKVMIVVER